MFNDQPTSQAMSKAKEDGDGRVEEKERKEEKRVEGGGELDGGGRGEGKVGGEECREKGRRQKNRMKHTSVQKQKNKNKKRETSKHTYASCNISHATLISTLLFQVMAACARASFITRTN